METGETGFNPENLSQEEKEEILRSVREKWIALSKIEDLLSLHDRVLDKAKELRDKYPDYEDYELYHLFIGSTTRDRSKFDFPGEDSVRKFVDAEFEKLENRPLRHQDDV
ncbi:MAG: hypothetical protein HY452_01010 [Parcubacteria group bacterium]|nr:hypothetical protein [Parcubacteria group bacterium]